MTDTDVQTTKGQPPALRIADAVATIKANVQMVQHVMGEVMKPEVHFGKIPGTDKPTLLQPGAEQICLAFGWATKYAVEDLSYTDCVRYRVTCSLYDRRTGELVGEGIGEASSDEEKYRWRKAICKEEFEATPEDRRRTKYGKTRDGGFYTVDQVRQQPADIANTVLKMGGKRAHIAATKTASGCSDMFAQDLEDLPPEVRESVVGEEEQLAAPMPTIGEADWKKLVKAGLREGYTEEDILASAAIAGHQGSGPEIPADLADRLYAAMKANPKLEAEEDGQGRLA
jgi:hypothetical protein